jgi:hypothetical protein
MKKCTLLVVLLMAFAANIFAQSSNTIQTSEVNPSSLVKLTKSQQTPNSVDALGDLLKNYNVDSLTPGNAGAYGVVWTGSYYIVSEFNANKFFRFTANWTRIDSFVVTGGTGLFRDMTFAKGLLWGVNVTGQIFGVDTATKAVVKTITTSLAQLRALCWDPYRNGFWVGTTSFTGPLVCVDTNGVTIPGASITTPASGLYSAGYEDYGSQANSFIWIGTDQTPTSTTGTALVKYNAQTLAVVGSPLNITIPLTTGAPLASGGGEVYNTLVPGKRVWLGMVQGTPDRVFAVELSDLPVPTGNDSTLVMFHDTTVATGQVKRLSDRDSVMKYIPGMISKYRTFYFNQTTDLPNLANYKTIILVETSFDNSGALAMGPAARTSLKAWLASGTPTNKKSLISIGGDQAYNYDRTGSANIDTAFSRGICGFIYKVDQGTPAATGGDITGLYAQDLNNVRTMVAPTGTGNTGYWPDGVSLAPGSGSVPVYKYNGHTAADTLGGTSVNNANYFTVTSFQDPRYFTGGVRPWLLALITYAKANGGTITNVTTPVSSVADKYQLSQNYPNPFNPTTKITFAIPTNGFVSLKVYDVAGKEVMTLVNKNMSVGSYSVDFSGALLSSGVYFYRLESGNFVETKKMMLVK